MRTPANLPAMAAALALLAVTACSALVPKLETPQLRVVSVAALGGSNAAQRLRVTIQVDNPNNRQLAVRSIDYRLLLGGQEFAQGTTPAPFTVPALGQSNFDLDVNIDILRALTLFAQNANAETLPYRVTGTVRLAEGALRTLPFTTDGTVPGPGRRR